MCVCVCVCVYVCVCVCVVTWLLLYNYQGSLLMWNLCCSHNEPIYRCKPSNTCQTHTHIHTLRGWWFTYTSMHTHTHTQTISNECREINRDESTQPLHPSGNFTILHFSASLIPLSLCLSLSLSLTHTHTHSLSFSLSLRLFLCSFVSLIMQSIPGCATHWDHPPVNLKHTHTFCTHHSTSDIDTEEILMTSLTCNTLLYLALPTPGHAIHQDTVLETSTQKKKKREVVK